MNALFERLPPNFLPSFLAGMAVNFEIAGIALALGLAFGLLLALARLQARVVGMAARAVVALMRAAPTFVVMFFLLNALPRGAGLSRVMIVGLSVVPYRAPPVAHRRGDAHRPPRAP